MRPLTSVLTTPAVAVALATSFLLSLGAAPVMAQDVTINFDSDLPRTLVFITEEGRADVATRTMSSFLLSLIHI